MAARRKTKRRRRRGIFGALFKLLSVLLVVAAVIAGCIVFFRVDDIQVEGTSKYTKEQIAEASGVKQNDNLFTINISQAAREILTAFPYVDQVSIHRRLPDTLVISVTECTPVACIQSGEDRWVLDAKGKLLEKGGEELAGRYIQVTGLTPILPSAGSNLAVGDADSGKLQCLTQLLSALESHEMISRVTAASLAEDTVMTLSCDGRFTVKLPMNGDFDLKVRILKEATAALQSNETGLIDLTGEKGDFQPG